jgi:hypothetical protein
VFAHLGKARESVKKVLEPAGIARHGVVLPTVDVDEEERAFRLVDET